MTESELESLVSRLFGRDQLRTGTIRPGAAKHSGRSALRPRTPKRLRPRGSAPHRSRRITPEKIGKFPPVQVILLDQKRRYEIERDDRMKLLSVPVWQGERVAVPGRKPRVRPNVASGRSSCPTSISSALKEPSWNGRLALLRTSRRSGCTPPRHDGRPAASAG